MILRNKSVYVLKIHTTPGRIDLEYRTFKSNKNNRNKIKDSKNTFFLWKATNNGIIYSRSDED